VRTDGKPATISIHAFVQLCTKTATYSGLLVRRTRAFGPLKQQFGGRRFHNNEEVETDVREWLQMQEPDVHRDGIFELVPRWNTLTYSGIV
jgi:hypothetical protein